MLKQMATPKKVIVYNHETNKRETWTWIQFQRHIAEFTAMFEDAGIDLNDLADGPIPEPQERPKYDH